MQGMYIAPGFRRERESSEWERWSKRIRLENWEDRRTQKKVSAVPWIIEFESIFPFISCRGPPKQLCLLWLLQHVQLYTLSIDIKLMKRLYYPLFLATDIRKNMHEGVIRDAERQRIKRERILELEEQQRLQKEYEKVQPVRKNGQWWGTRSGVGQFDRRDHRNCALITFMIVTDHT